MTNEVQVPSIRDLPRLAWLTGLGAAVLLAACETPVSLQEPRRVAPLPPLRPSAPLPAESVPAPSPPVVQPLPQAVPMPVPALPSQAPTPPVEPPLLAEQRWLTQWFVGTPVVIAMQGDGSLRVEVPLEFSFDAGSALIKPALAAVLDRVATSTRRVDGRLLIEAPADADAASTQRLSLDRATSLRQHLVARGVGPQHINDAPPARGTAVALHLALPAP
jgi:outer membrane protein OmpA-like peptidoglycan-associated protein